MTPQEAQSWALDDKGNIILQPLVSYQVVLAAEMSIVVQLNVLTQAKDDPDQVGQAIAAQLVLTPIQAEALSQSLINAANKAQQKPSNTPS